jgi:hypothetical protein
MIVLEHPFKQLVVDTEKACGVGAAFSHRVSIL